MWGLLRQQPASALRYFRSYSSGSLTPSELRFKKKLEEAERQRRRNAPEWEKREETLRKRYGTWNPTKKLSRQQMSDIRDLKARAPELKTVQIADFFKINPESIRRILKSSWLPNEDERARQELRGEKRKAESLERKKTERELAKLGLPVLATSSSIPAQEPDSQGKSDHKKKTIIQPLKYGAAKKNGFLGRKTDHRYKHQKHGATSRDYGPPRRRMPFTEGVGDFLE